MLRPATYQDVVALAPRLRNADEAELRAAGHTCMLTVLIESLMASEEAFAYDKDGAVVALFGVAVHDGQGVPWLLGDETLHTHGRELLTLPVPLLKRWLQRYGTLLNLIHASNRRNIKWLKRLGFTIHPPFEVRGHLFHTFTMR